MGNDVLAAVKQIGDGAAKALESHKSAIEGLSDRLERIEALRDRPRGSLGNTPEAKEFNNWARTGAGLTETKEMSIGGGAAAGEALVPEIIADQIISKALAQGPIANIVRRTVADSSDYVRIVNLRGQSAAWSSEAGTRSVSDTMQFREVRPTHGELYAYVVVSNWLLQDAKFDVAALVTENAAAQFARALETSVISGNGSSRPTGLLASNPTTAADDASPPRAADVLRYVAGTADLANDLVSLYFDLKPEYRANATYAMSSASLAAVRKLRDSNGSGYLFQERLAGAVDAGDGTILGKRVITSEDLDAVGASPADFSVLCGDFTQGYELVQYGGLSILRDPYTTKGKTGFYIAARFGGRITDNDAIRVLAA
jgi:HK97 family phage major capsid protein